MFACAGKPSGSGYRRQAGQSKNLEILRKTSDQFALDAASASSFSRKQGIFERGLCGSSDNFRGGGIGGFFAGAEGAFAGEAIEIIAAKFERRSPCGKLFAQSSHFAQSPRRELCDADIPAYKVNEEDFATAFGKILLHDVACLLLQGFVVRIQTTKLRSVPKKNSGHARALGTAIWRSHVLHFDFRTGHNVGRERVACVGNIRRFRKRPRRIDNPGIPRAREPVERPVGEVRAERGDQLSGNGKNNTPR